MRASSSRCGPTERVIAKWGLPFSDWVARGALLASKEQNTLRRGLLCFGWYVLEYDYLPMTDHLF